MTPTPPLHLSVCRLKIEIKFKFHKESPLHYLLKKYAEVYLKPLLYYSPSSGFVSIVSIFIQKDYNYITHYIVV